MDSVLHRGNFVFTAVVEGRDGDRLEPRAPVSGVRGPDTLPITILYSLTSQELRPSSTGSKAPVPVNDPHRGVGGGGGGGGGTV